MTESKSSSGDTSFPRHQSTGISTVPPKPEPSFDWDALERQRLELIEARVRALSVHGGFTSLEYEQRHGVCQAVASARIKDLLRDGVIRMIGHRRKVDKTGRSGVRVKVYDFVGPGGQG